MFSHETVIRLQHTDAAGLIFCSRLFDLAHVAYEAFLDEIGHPLPTALAAGPVVLPIVHASADYRAPMRLNDRVRIELWVEIVNPRSFELRYRFLKDDGTLAAGARTVHVAVRSGTGDSVRLPEPLAAALEPHRAAGCQGGDR